MSGDDRDAERASHAQLEAEIARHMDEIDAANNRWRSAKAECAAVADEFRRVEAERDAALARIATLEAALRPFAEKARWFQVTDGPSFPAGFVTQISVSVGDLSAARAALADAPGDEAEPAGPDE